MCMTEGTYIQPSNSSFCRSCMDVRSSEENISLCAGSNIACDILFAPLSCKRCSISILLCFALSFCYLKMKLFLDFYKILFYSPWFHVVIANHLSWTATQILICSSCCDIFQIEPWSLEVVVLHTGLPHSK